MTEIFSVMLLAWPNAEMFKGGVAKLGPTIELWAACLSDVDFWLGQQAVIRLCRECKFPPSIAEFKEKADNVQQEIRSRIDLEWNDTTSNYTSAGVTLCSSGWIKDLGLSNTFPWAFLPDANGGSETTYIPDYVDSNSGWQVLVVGGDWNDGSYAGLFFFYAYYSSSHSSGGIGARLLFHP